MIIFPAIDMRGGKCVRLRQGDYSQETVFSEDPVAVARHWQAQSAEYLHLVDLDAARTGHPVNLPSVQAILRDVQIPCQLGGGIRDETTVAQWLALGLQRVILGTTALEQPDTFRSLCRRFPGRVVLGLDARDGQVAVRGWEKTSNVRAEALLHQFEDVPLAAVIYTDIHCDGMMQGPNVEAIARVATGTRWPVIASGGIRSADDVARLARLPLEGCIIGRALYEGTLRLAEAKQAADSTISDHQVRRDDGKISSR